MAETSPFAIDPETGESADLIERPSPVDCAQREGPVEAAGAPRPVDMALTRADPTPSVQQLRERYRTPSQVVEAPRGRP